MNREDFIEIFSQNIQVLGSKGRVFASLVYSSADTSSLLPGVSAPRVMLIPIGKGFRVAISKNEKSLDSSIAGSRLKSLRVTGRIFKSMADLGLRHGYSITDLTLSRGTTETVNVRNDPDISREFYGKLAEDGSTILTHVGLTNGQWKLFTDISMKLVLYNFERDAGSLVFEILSSVLDEEPLYRGLENAFIPKRDETWASSVNPITMPDVKLPFSQLLGKLSSAFPKEADFGMSGDKSMYFSSGTGVWGEIIAIESGIRVHFMSEADFDFGVQLIDVLGSVVTQ